MQSRTSPSGGHPLLASQWGAGKTEHLVPSGHGSSLVTTPLSSQCMTLPSRKQPSWAMGFSLGAAQK